MKKYKFSVTYGGGKFLGNKSPDPYRILYISYDGGESWSMVDKISTQMIEITSLNLEMDGFSKFH